MLEFIRTTIRQFRPYWKAVSLILIALLVQTGFKIGLPLGYSEIFDGAIAENDHAYLVLLLLLLTGFWLLNLVAGLLQDRATATAGAQVMNDLRLKLFKQLQRLPVSYFRQRDSGDLMSLFSNDLAAIEVAYLRSIYTVLYSSIVLLFSVVLLFFIEWRLALLTFASLPIALLGPKLIGAKAQRLNYERKNHEATVNAVVTESIGTAAEVRAFGLQELKLSDFKRQLNELASRIQHAFITAALVGRTSSQTIQLVQILIMGVGGYLAISGNMTVGSIVGFAALLMNVSNAANHLAASMPELLPASAAFQRINEYLNIESVQQSEQHTVPCPDFAEICFDQVCLSYGKDSKAALQNVSLQIPAGKSIAIVGSSGSGKSTILNLILRLYTPSAGRICLDEVDLANISEASLREHSSVVMQNTLLFNSSFRENISMGHPDVDDNAIVRAAKQAEIHDYIEALPNGYDTQVGEWGDNLSGGQRQRIAIARAMLRDPKLLVLDEATSALDPATEHAINDTLSHFTQGRTVISTTHRLTAARHADLILVMESGRIVEQGTHSQLLATQGAYSALWQKQSGFDLKPDGGVEMTTKRLAEIPLLRCLSEARLESLQMAALFAPESFPAGRTLFSSGDFGDKFYIIVHGKVDVSWQDPSTGETQQQVLEDGDYFGEMALLVDAPRNATVCTRADSLMLSLGRREFNALLHDEPNLRATIETEVHTRLASRS